VKSNDVVVKYQPGVKSRIEKTIGRLTTFGRECWSER